MSAPRDRLVARRRSRVCSSPALAVLAVALDASSRPPSAQAATPRWRRRLSSRFAAVGALIASRQPGNAIGWIFLAARSRSGARGSAGEYAIYALRESPAAAGRLWAGWLSRSRPGPRSIACS